jgi:hypothetical protein
MNEHLSDHEMVALLHGTLSADERAEAKRHLSGCEPCAATLAREAALDEVLWTARSQAPRPLPARARRGAALGWLAGAAATAALVYAGATAPAMAARSIDMGDLLAWHNLIFYIPLALGALLVLGSFVGGHGHGHDVGHDHDHDADHHALGSRALSLLGVGRVPLTVALMTASFLFGGIGVCLNAALASAGLTPGVYGPIALGSAIVYTLLLARPTAALLQRLLPSVETYIVARRDLIGCTGTLLLPSDAASGYAQVKDREGNVHNIQCRAVKALAKGEPILIVDYDEESKSYLIDAIPKL